MHYGVQHGKRRVADHTCLPALDNEFVWYRIVGFGLDGFAHRSIEAAWNSYDYAGHRAYGYARPDRGTSIVAHSAVLVEATTWRAADAADVSRLHGTVGRGEWRRSRAIVPDHTCLPALDNEFVWYRIVGSGLDGAARQTIEAAWESYYRAGHRAYGYARPDRGTSIAAHSAVLVEATTRRAADAADVSRLHGTAGRGEWRRTTTNLCARWQASKASGESLAGFSESQRPHRLRDLAGGGRR